MYEDDHPLAPVDDAGMGEHIFHEGQFILEEPIPAVPIQEIPPREEDADDAEMDPVDHSTDPEEDPSVIIIASDDEEEVEEEQDEEEENPKEILFNDDKECDVFSDVTTE